MSYKINILGSCVSRVSMLDGNQNGHNTAAHDIDMIFFLDKQNIVCAMYPPAFNREEVDAIKAEELWDKTRLRSLQQCLNKDTIQMLMESDAEWLIMYLFDMQTDFASCNDTIFSTCAHEFLNTGLCRKYQQNIKTGNILALPTWVYYGIVDIFFQTIMQKYDKDHIILNCFRANTYFLDKDGIIKEIPESYKKNCQANDKYNAPLLRLENYIINKYQPVVIDLSKYFMGDKNYWDNIQGAHFEKEFYRETFDIISSIIRGETNERYFSNPRFFIAERRGFDEDMTRNFDVESGIEIFEKLLNANDILWLNVLDKLSFYAPTDDRVRQYLKFLENSF